MENLFLCLYFVACWLLFSLLILSTKYLTKIKCQIFNVIAVRVACLIEWVNDTPITC